MQQQFCYWLALFSCFFYPNSNSCIIFDIWMYCFKLFCFMLFMIYLNSKIAWKMMLNENDVVIIYTLSETLILSCKMEILRKSNNYNKAQHFCRDEFSSIPMLINGKIWEIAIAIVPIFIISSISLFLQC